MSANTRTRTEAKTDAGYEASKVALNVVMWNYYQFQGLRPSAS